MDTPTKCIENVRVTVITKQTKKRTRPEGGCICKLFTVLIHVQYNMFKTFIENHFMRTLFVTHIIYSFLAVQIELLIIRVKV